MRRNKNVKPKFARGSKVKVCDDIPSCMSNYKSEFNAIVQYTFAQKYGGDDNSSYSIIILNNSDEPINGASWYGENQLTLISDDVTKGKEIIERYEFG